MGTLAVLAGCGIGDGRTNGYPMVPTFAEDNRAVPPKKLTKLPGECAELILPEQFDEILKVKFDGSSRDVVGIAEPKIDLLTRLSCYYGLSSSRDLSGAKLYIGLALYGAPESAKERLDKAVEDRRKVGAQESQLWMGKREARLMTGPNDRMVAYRSEDLTLLVNLANGVVPEDRAAAVATKLGETVLRTLGR
jgi:hypothetical protein